MKSITVFLVSLFLTVMMIMPVAAAQYVATNEPINGLGDVTKQHFTDVTDITYDGSAEGERVMMMTINVPADSSIDFTLSYGNDSTVSGTLENHHINLGIQTVTTITFDGVTKSYTFIDVNPYYEVDLAGYAKNSTDETEVGFLVYGYTYGLLDNDLAVFKPVSNIESNLIYAVHMTGTVPFDIEVDHAPYSTVASGVSKTTTDVIWDWINLGLSITGMLYDFVVGLFYWAKFFLWDNLLMTIALYISLTLAFAARNSKGNMEKFYRQFFNDQKKFWEFMIGVFNVLITIITNMKNLFTKWI